MSFHSHIKNSWNTHKKIQKKTHGGKVLKKNQIICLTSKQKPSLRYKDRPFARCNKFIKSELLNSQKCIYSLISFSNISSVDFQSRVINWFWIFSQKWGLLVCKLYTDYTEYDDNTIMQMRGKMRIFLALHIAKKFLLNTNHFLNKIWLKVWLLHLRSFTICNSN